MTLKPAKTALIAALLYVSLFCAQNRLDREQALAFQQSGRLVIFPKPSVVRLASLGHKNLLADYYWLKTIQYLGACIMLKIKPMRLYRYAQFVTDIDPKFFEAYYYPAAVMIVDRISPEQTIALLEKGKKSLPDQGLIPALLGFSYYYFMHDNEQAAQNFDLAAKLRNYAGYAILAARIRGEEGSAEVSLDFLNQLTQDSKMSRWASEINQMIIGLGQHKQLALLNRLIDQYQSLKGQYPNRVSDLVKAGLISQIPQDPMGGNYYIDPETHRAKSTQEFYTGVYRPRGWELE